MGIVLILTIAFAVVQVLVGVGAHSLALLTDAGHNFTDAFAIALVLVASVIGQRQRRTNDDAGGETVLTVEALSALVTAILMLAVSAYVLVEAVHRLGTPHPISGKSVFAVGCLGLAVNVVAILVLRAGDTTHVAARGVYLEVLSDALGSGGVVIAGALAWAFQWYRADAMITIAIGALMVPRSIALGRDALRLLRR
jgi:cobalt-zinc-cadmium efflux system protein